MQARVMRVGAHLCLNLMLELPALQRIAIGASFAAFRNFAGQGPRGCDRYEFEEACEILTSDDCCCAVRRGTCAGRLQQRNRNGFNDNDHHDGNRAFVCDRYRRSHGERGFLLGPTAKRNRH